MASYIIGNTSDNTSQRNVIFFSSTGDYLINAVYVMATVINLVANTLICVAVGRKTSLHNPINYLLVNLSIADIVCAIGIYPFIFMIDILGMPGSNYKVTCSFTGAFIFHIGSGASLLTLSTISLTRYLGIRFPLRAEFRLSKRGTKLFIMICWTVSIAFLMPSALTYEYSYTLNACVRDWGAINGTLYRFTLLFFTLFVPLTLLIFCYTAIATSRKTPPPGLTETAHMTRLQNLKKAENLVRLLMVNYLLCWSPFLFYWILASFTKYFQLTFNGQTLKLRWIRITMLFATFNGTVDPFLYIPSNKGLKKEVQIVLRKVLPFRSSRFYPQEVVASSSS